MGWLPRFGKDADEAGIDGVLLRRSARARRMTLRVSRLDGRVTLTLPVRTSLGEARQFVDGQSDWIARARAGIEPERRVAVGDVLMLFGQDVRLCAGTGRAARRIADGISVAPDRAGPAVKALILSETRAHARRRVDDLAARIGRPAGALRLADPRGRWGSCSARGDIMLSWRLALAPLEVLDYVIAHEVAHLSEMNHSRAFWEVVEMLCPGHREPRAWLRAEGPALHRIRFD